MNVSKLIELLERAKELYGDLEVRIFGDCGEYTSDVRVLIHLADKVFLLVGDDLDEPQSRQVCEVMIRDKLKLVL